MQNRWLVLSAVACGTFMATLDASIVNLALPTLNRTFGVAIGLSKWVIVAYFSIITCLLLPFGQWSDRIGRKRVFTIGFVTFTLASLLCGLSPNLNALIFSRIMQGLGSAMLMANGPALITQTFVSRDRGLALGILSMVVSIGLISGPALGGPLIESAGWRSIFLLNVPVGLAGIALVTLFVPRDTRVASKIPFDWPGALLQSIIILGLIEISDFRNDLDPALRVVGAALLIFATYVFLRVERLAAQPLFDANLLRDTLFWTGNLSGFLMFFAYSSASILFPFLLESALLLSPQQSGLLYSIIPITILVVAPFAGRLSDRRGSIELCTLGALIMSATLFFLAKTELNASTAMIPLAGIGLALGLFQSPNNNAIMGTVPRSKLGTASAFLATVRNLGLVTGSHFSTGLFSWNLARTQNFAHSMQYVWWIAGMIALGAVLGSLGKLAAKEN